MLNSTHSVASMPLESELFSPILWDSGDQRDLPDDLRTEIADAAPTQDVAKVGLAARLLAAIEIYRRLGWLVFPVIGKKPFKKFKWTNGFTNERVDNLLLDPRCTGIALICGEASGDIVIRDFDDEGAYQRWVANKPDLGKILPTVKNHRGFHVYARCPGFGLEFYEDGELRGNGGYVVTAPSLHPDGSTYEWVIRPHGEIPLVDPKDLAGIKKTKEISRPELKSNTSTNPRKLTINPECSTVTISVVVGRGGCVCVGICACDTPLTSFPEPLRRKIEQVILQSLPVRVGERNSRIFDCVLALKAFLPHDLSRVQIEAIAAHWHRRALRVIGTKPFEETRKDFVNAWERVHPSQGEFFNRATLLAKDDAWSTGLGRKEDELAKVFRAASHLHEGRSFFGDCRTLGRAIAASHATVLRAVRKLVDAGLLSIVANGTRAKPRKGFEGKATEYRWDGPQLQLEK